MHGGTLGMVRSMQVQVAGGNACWCVCLSVCLRRCDAGGSGGSSGGAVPVGLVEIDVRFCTTRTGRKTGRPNRYSGYEGTTRWKEVKQDKKEEEVRESESKRTERGSPCVLSSPLILHCTLSRAGAGQGVGGV